MVHRWNLLRFLPTLAFGFLLSTISNETLASKDGFIGCLFENGLCQVGKEWCYDDALFGQCLPLQSDAYDLSITLRRGSIGEMELAAFEAAITQLQRSGHQWDDVVTQCVLQRIKNFFQSGDSKNPAVCLEIHEKGVDKKQDIEQYINQEDTLQSASLIDKNQDHLQATVYLSPSDLTVLAELAKGELYDMENTGSGQNTLKESETKADMPDSAYFKQIKNLNPILIDSNNINSLLSNEEEAAKQQLARRWKQILSWDKEAKSLYNQIDSMEELDNSEDDSVLPTEDNIYSNNANKFERQERQDVKKPGPWFSVNNFAFENGDANDEDKNKDNLLSDLWVVSNDYPTLEGGRQNIDKGNRVDAETYYQSNSDVDVTNSDRIAVLLEKLNDEQEASLTYNKEDVMINSPEDLSATWLKPTSSKVDKTAKEKLFITSVKQRKNQSDYDYSSTSTPDHEIVEADYAFVTIKQEFPSWKEGADLVNTLSGFMQVPRETFTDVSVQGNKVTFRVMPNVKGLSPSAVAAKTDEMRYKIRKFTGFEVDATGIGDQTRVSSILYWGQENQQMLVAVGICFLATAILVAAAIVFLLRNRYVARQKLKDLTQPTDTEATRDYQDLCRARMGIKNSTSTDAGCKDSTKMPHTLFSRDSESSRSSTSSWSEEPVLTNMDISTGHMVLSYMEDHLRNKDRLDEEWQALCGYEAESSTSILIASKPENQNKNRSVDVLPYDHSRVILNAVFNITGSDYYNASYIADHDPRHPAYIAAQTPLADTTADFWQMVWEQGSVVLVLLTRLNENGVELCYNYWPEEGSQLYHIYEVHLVSEHIWCDDYLVRSFYLKNIRTGETRTVTQFHFQSWPNNGIPSSTKALLEFRRKVNKSYRGRSCPIVVHCSDGAGRTGTYCLIDMVLHRMAKGAREIDIAATLEHLRDQRAEAVRNKQQFEFVLTSVAEEVHAILRALPQ